VIETVEPRVSNGDGILVDPDDAGDFFKLLAPGEKWEEADQQAMESFYAEIKRGRKLMKDADARKKAQEPPEEEKGGEASA